MESPPAANRRTKSRWASSKGSTTKSASSNDARTACATKSTFGSKYSPACCRCSDTSPAFLAKIHPHDFTKTLYFLPPLMIVASPDFAGDGPDGDWPTQFRAAGDRPGKSCHRYHAVGVGTRSSAGPPRLSPGADASFSTRDFHTVAGRAS